MRFVVAVTMLLLAAPPSQAVAAAVHDVTAGEPIRRILLDTVRPAVERDLGQKVRFVVETLRVDGDWAFATVSPRTIKGARIDFSRTRHADRQAAGILDGDTIYALLERRSGHWVVRSFAVGPTDVAWAAWPDEYGAPPRLFGLPEK